MTEHDRLSALQAIAALGTPEDVLHIPLAGALYFQDMGGPAISAYWPSLEVADESDVIGKQRGELFLVVTSALSLASLYARPSLRRKQQEFDVAFLFFLKGFAQTVVSMHTLCLTQCYLDAFALTRSLAGRVNLLALFALGPHLFDEMNGANLQKTNASWMGMFVMSLQITGSQSFLICTSSSVRQFIANTKL